MWPKHCRSRSRNNTLSSRWRDDGRACIQRVLIKSGDLFISGGGSRQFVGAQNIFDPFETIGRALLHQLHDLFRSIAAVGQHDARGRRPPFGFIGV